LFAGNEDIGHTAKAAGYPIDEFASSNGVGNVLARRTDPREDVGVGSEPNLGSLARHAHDISNCEPLTTYHYRIISKGIIKRKWGNLARKNTSIHAHILAHVATAIPPRKKELEGIIHAIGTFSEFRVSD